MQILINIILSYLLGSISGSMVLGRLKGIDIRSMGSGNAGGTNAFRSVGFLFALGVVFIDISKGLISVLFLSKISFFNSLSIELIEYSQILCGLAAVLGHVYPIYYNFKGGKGAGTLIGVIGILFPQSIFYSLLSWIVVLIFTGFVGLGTIVASFTLVVITLLMYPEGILTPFGVFTITMFVFIVFTHRSNIIRMINGTENQFKKVMIFKNFFN
tara:strand:- start:1256 stop:1897 length:642 start_codon:yes stop_codon:yes gene_type:complete